MAWEIYKSQIQALIDTWKGQGLMKKDVLAILQDFSSDLNTTFESENW